MTTNDRHVTLALGLVLLLGGCLGAPLGDDESTVGDTAGGDETAATGTYCHGLLTADEPSTEPGETVPLSDETIQSADPVVTVLERYRRNGTRQRMGVDGDRANASLEALQALDGGGGPSPSAHVRLDDSTTAVVWLASNGTLCGPIP